MRVELLSVNIYPELNDWDYQEISLSPDFGRNASPFPTEFR